MHFYEFDDPEAEITFKRMRPLVEARIGAWETPECQAWAVHPALRIMYVNSFALVGEAELRARADDLDQGAAEVDADVVLRVADDPAR